MVDAWERRMDALLDATDENTKSRVIDAAVSFYLKMRVFSATTKE